MATKKCGKYDWKTPVLLIRSAVGQRGTTSSRRDLTAHCFCCASLVLLPSFIHGSAILLGPFGGPGPQNFSAFLDARVILACLVGLAQVAGGLATLTGVLFRVGALGIGVIGALVEKVKIARQDTSASLTKCSTVSRLEVCLYRERCD